ncbi:MAG: hypothetical protein WCF85_18545 [Rhodospirillaceae bacterium]
MRGLKHGMEEVAANISAAVEEQTAATSVIKADNAAVAVNASSLQMDPSLTGLRNSA